MPYIITTSEPFAAAAHMHYPAFSRCAVATLDEAREHAWEACKDACGPNAATVDMHDQVNGMLTDGGTIGPLPDGTVIEVKRISWDEVFRVGHPRDQDLPRSRYGDFELIDAFNDEVAR